MKSLPSMEHAFSVDIIGEETQERFNGNFTYKRPSLGRRNEIEKMIVKLSEDLFSLSDDVKFFNRMVSQLRYGLIESPEWWVKSNYGLDLYDANVVIEIYKKVMEFETKWETEVYGKKEEKKDDK